MISFDRPYAKTLMLEGGAKKWWSWSNDPDDPGGETVGGISRVKNPRDAVWPIVDAAKLKPDFPNNLKDNIALEAAVLACYENKFWNPYKLSEWADEDLAWLFYDCCVNHGPGNASRFLQEALNECNIGGTLWPDMAEDGDFGKTTWTCLKIAMGRGDSKILLGALLASRGAFIREMLRKSQQKEKWRGWFVRLLALFR